MTTRNLDALFEPKAIALVGASNEPRSVGAVLARNLLDAGFDGPVLTVNPHEDAIRSVLSYRSIGELPVTPDLAVVATPPATVPQLIGELGARGCRACVVVTAGFGEGARVEGVELRQKMLDAARPHLLRIVGPNCLGFISPARRINASFAHLTPAAGDVAFVSQSGAIVTAVLDWAAARGIGFSQVISVGDMADVDFGDLLDYLAEDRATRAILLYVESITDARKFMSAGRIASRAKPVVVIKSGRSSAGASAARSHTGALAGSDRVYDAAFRRAGMLRVDHLRDLFEAVATLSTGIVAAGDRLTVLTNGGGAGVLAADALEMSGGRLAALGADTIARLDRVLPPTWSRSNPVDILGDATGKRYGDALAALLADSDHDAILVLNCPTAVADSLEAAEAVVERIPNPNRTPVLTCWLGENAAADARRLFAAKDVPTFETPDEAVKAFMQLVEYRRNQDLLLQTPPATPRLPAAESDRARAIVEKARSAGRSLLTEPEAKAVLSAYSIPIVRTEIAADPAGAARIAARLGFPVALKILSEQVTHKSDVGGVRLDLPSPAAVEAAAREMLATVGAAVPDAEIEGFTVQAMVRRPHAHELLVGIGDDPTFGPVILFGQGGTATEVIGDRAIGLPPLNMALAKEIIARTHIARMLRGYRDRPPVDIEAVALVLVRLSQMIVDLPEIGELDINPLLADEAGVIALDARIVIRPGTSLLDRMAIRPYPAELEHEVELADGFRFLVRPIRPEDEPALVEMVDRSTDEDVRLRFLGPLKELPHAVAARLSQIDYSREMAFIATGLAGSPEDGDVLGVARLIGDPENEKAEFAVMVRSDLKGRGVGFLLMGELIAYARKRGLKTLFGVVLRENRTMLEMADQLGFIRTESAAPDIVDLSLDLTR